eukprot:7713378-Pyramimonas_sp.AAC.3
MPRRVVRSTRPILPDSGDAIAQTTQIPLIMHVVTSDFNYCMQDVGRTCVAKLSNLGGNCRVRVPLQHL